MATMFGLCLFLLAFAALSSASPLAAAPAGPAFAQIPRPSLGKRVTNCTFSGSGGVAAAMASKAACRTMVLSNLAVPSGATLNLSGLSDNTTVIFEGETTWGYKEWTGPLLQIGGSGITVMAANGARLNPDGARWWDGKGSGGKTKPKFLSLHSLTNSRITNLYILNTPVHAVSINSARGLTITNMTIDNAAGDAGGGHNTDGFDIGHSTGVRITGANVHNQDDCVAVNSGTDITVENSACIGGHGLSIGSVGGRDDSTVDTVTFANNEVKNSANGIRVKARRGDRGTITKVTYNNITLSNISRYGILVEQNYASGGDLKGTATSGIPITGLTLRDIAGHGGVTTSGYNVAIACGSGACSDWTWTNVAVSGGRTYGSCTNVPKGISC